MFYSIISLLALNLASDPLEKVNENVLPSFRLRNVVLKNFLVVGTAIVGGI